MPAKQHLSVHSWPGSFSPPQRAVPRGSKLDTPGPLCGHLPATGSLIFAHTPRTSADLIDPYNRVIKLELIDKSLEARGVIEPPNKGVADLCLTTWLPRRYGCCLGGHYS